MSLSQKLDTVLKKYEDLENQLNEGCADPKEFGKISKEYSDMGPVVVEIKTYQTAVKEFADLEEIIADKSGDAELRELAELEYYELKDKLPDLEQKIKVLLLPKDEADAMNAIIEVRAGTGGDEAALFAGDLLRMYQRYAELRGWKTELMSSADSDQGGVKEAVLAIS